MNDRGPILVPLDGSELAEGVLHIAAEVARAERTHLVLLSVWQEPGSGTPAVISVEMEQKAQEYFETYLHGVRERLKQPEVRTIVRSGDPSRAILEVADEIGARMIVVATHGRSGVNRWLYGSTTSHLLHESRLPLLAAGPKTLGARAAQAAVRHVMVPLDGSELAEVALNSGLELAVAFGARLSLVRVVGWAYESYPYAGAATYIPALDSELEREAEHYLQKCVASVSTKTEVHPFVVHGAVADALLTFEEQQQVGLVVMTTHARTGLARAALGSTAERMLQGAAPVLLLRPETPIA